MFDKRRKSQHTQNQEYAQTPQEEMPEEPVLMDTESGEWYNAADSNEPRYCLCNEISYGDMVACDNESVCENFCGSLIFFYQWQVKKCYCCFLVPDWMVSLWLCRNRNFSQGIF